MEININSPTMLVIHILDIMWWKWDCTSDAFLPKSNILRLINKKTSDIHNQGIVYITYQYFLKLSVQFSSVQSLSRVRLFGPHESQYARPPCPSPTPGVHPNSCPSSRWCHPAISSSVVPFSSCLQSLPASGSFPTTQLFTWSGQSIGVSALASVLPKKS